jgi:DNA processing protein
MNHPILPLEIQSLPERMREIPQPAKQLFTRGEHILEKYPHHKYLAIVGSRACTSYGKKCVDILVESLRGLPVVIVSGFAYGIDTAAHKAAIRSSLPTIAVPGSGLGDRVIYPRENASFIPEFLAHGGMFLSEYEEDKKSERWMFPARNRIMAGLCHAVLIVEAEEKSGTLITARLALDYNRDVLVVPGNITSQNSLGTNRLIHDGATPITCGDDLREALGFTRKDDEAKNNPDSSTASSLVFSNDTERLLYDLLREPLPKDELFEKSGLSITDFSVTLSMMELSGLVEEKGGDMWRV